MPAQRNSGRLCAVSFCRGQSLVNGLAQLTVPVALHHGFTNALNLHAHTVAPAPDDGDYLHRLLTLACLPQPHATAEITTGRPEERACACTLGNAALAIAAPLGAIRVDAQVRQYAAQPAP